MTARTRGPNAINRLRRGEHPSLRAAIYEALRSDIVRGVLPPGGAVNIRDLQARFGVGSSAVREALCQLAADDLVIALEQRGFRIAATSLRDLEDVTRMRIEIETLALREAIQRGDAAWETLILTRFHELYPVHRGGAVEATSEADVAAARSAHRAFHDALIEPCTSTWAKRFRSTLNKHAERYMAFCRDVVPGERDVDAEHRAIVSAALARNDDEACLLMTEHLRATARMLIRAGVAV